MKKPPQTLIHRSTWRGQVKNPWDPPLPTHPHQWGGSSPPPWTCLRFYVKSSNLITTMIWLLSVCGHANGLLTCKTQLFMWTNINISQRRYCRDDVFPLINEKSYGGMLISPSATTGTIVTKSTILKLTRIISGIFHNHTFGETTYSSAENRVPGIFVTKQHNTANCQRQTSERASVFFLGVHLWLIAEGDVSLRAGCGVVFLVMQNNNRQKEMTDGMYE